MAPESSPFGQAGLDCRGFRAEALAREIGELLQQRPLVTARKAGLDRIEIEKVGKLHGRTRDWCDLRTGPLD